MSEVIGTCSVSTAMTSTALRLTDRYTSLDGVTHLVFKQRAHGIESHDTFLGANVTADGRLVELHRRARR